MGTQRMAEMERETECLWLSLLLSSWPLSLGNKISGDRGLASVGQELSRHGSALRVGTNFRLEWEEPPTADKWPRGEEGTQVRDVCRRQSPWGTHGFPVC